MARVVMIHGAFNELWGPHELKARWLPALLDGLWHHGVSIDADDVAVCFYGDEFRLDLDTLDMDQWQESKAGAEELLGALTGTDAMEALSQAADKATKERTVAMIATMTGDPSLTDRISQRLVDRIDTDTVVLVAHSLGTVIAHRTLAARPDIEIDTLVTLGSPLGSGFYVDDRESGEWPGSVKRWVNITARGDVVADTGRLAAVYGDAVEQHRIDNGHRAHHPEPYLNSKATGAAIARALTE